MGFICLVNLLSGTHILVDLFKLFVNVRLLLDAIAKVFKYDLMTQCQVISITQSTSASPQAIPNLSNTHSGQRRAFCGFLVCMLLGGLF